MKTFIVDDSELLRKSLKDMLADLPGVDLVGEAANVLQAVSGITQTDPDVVILDIRLPDGSGLDVLKALRSRRDPARFIIFTNFPEPHYREIFLQEGAAYFFDKATEHERLLQCVESLAAVASGCQEL